MPWTVLVVGKISMHLGSEGVEGKPIHKSLAMGRTKW